MSTTLLLIFAGAYLLGSVPFGLLVAKGFGLRDPRTIGSGNIGATNVLRTGNKMAAFVTLLLDGGKGAVAVLVAPVLATVLSTAGMGFPPATASTAATIAGLGAFAGHLFPIFLLFRGGKGVATYLGIILGLFWPAGLVACGIWLTMAALFRISSLSAITAVCAMPIVLGGMGQGWMIWLAVVMGVLVLFRHAANLERIFLGTEPRIGGTRKT